MAQVMEPHVLQPSALTETEPSLFQTHVVLARHLARQHVGIARGPRQAGQELQRWRAEQHRLGSRLGIR